MLINVTAHAEESRIAEAAIQATLEEAYAAMEPYRARYRVPERSLSSSSLHGNQLKDLADGALRMMRRILDDLPVDRFGSIQKRALPSDKFFEAYDALYRWRCTSHRELAAELNKGDRLVDGFYDLAAFPDGKGGYHLDNFGMKGKWLFEIHSQEVPANRFVLRAIDAVSLALNPLHPNGAEARVIFEDGIDDTCAEGLYLGNGIAIHPSCKSIWISAPFWRLDRSEQVTALRSLLAEPHIATLGTPIAVTQTTILSNERPDLMLVFLASLRPNRAADYANHRFGYRIKALAQALASVGTDVSFQTVEDDETFGAFLDSYRQKPTDIVMFSLYQHRQQDLEWLHALTVELRTINPRVFLIVEGPATVMFKQLLCLLPEINMLIRGDAQGIIDGLLDIKRKNADLSSEELLDLSNRRVTGFFVRSGRNGIISNSDRSNFDQQPMLIHPTRSLTDEWLCQRGCPEKCNFCVNPEGRIIKGRSIPAKARIEWMVDRLATEIAEQQPTRDEIKAVLEQQAATDDHLGMRFRLHPDTFIGTARVSVTLLGQNETANKRILLQWAQQIKTLGLHKYFRFKIADAAVASFGNEHGSQADKVVHVERDLLVALKESGVTFIGMGVENLEINVLNELEKGYTADLPIAVVKSLLENGFDPGGIRGNIIASTPDSTMAVAHASSLLLYVSPIYNSVLFRFGNGWGNARTPRVYSHGPSLWSSIGIARHPEGIRFADPHSAAALQWTDSVVRFGDFFVPCDMHEYSLQNEISHIKYIDERIPAMLTELLYPVFYRYHIVDFLETHLTASDVLRAIDVLKKDDKSSQIASFVQIFHQYQTLLPHLSPLRVIRHIKADMVALELFSFDDYRTILARHPDLPRQLEQIDVATVFEQGDTAMIPGQFDPDKALACFADAGFRAQQTLLAAGGGDARRWSGLPGSPTAPEELKTLSNIEELLQARRREAQKLTYRLMSYPDIQAIEWLGAVFALDSDDELFARVVDRMNQSKLPAASAVEGLIRQRLSLDAAEYGRLLKTSKKFSNVYLFANAGLLRRLKEGRAVAAELHRLHLHERDPLVAKLIQVNLEDFHRRAEARC